MAYTVIMNSILLPAAKPEPRLLPLLATPIPAGFPTPASDEVDQRLDLNALLVQDEAATYFLRVRGDSMRDAGIHDGALVVVDAGRQARPGDIVVAETPQGFTIKRLRRRGAQWLLEAANPDWPARLIGPEEELRLFGVVTATVLMLSR